MDTDDYLEGVRDILQEPTADLWADATLLRYLNWAMNIVQGVLIEAVEGDHLLIESTALSIVSGTQEYSINDVSPAGYGSIRSLKRVERVWTTNPGFLEQIPFDHRDRYSSVSTTSSVTYPARYYLKFPKVGFVPSPQKNISDAVKFHGHWHYADMAAGGAGPTDFENYPPCQRMLMIRAAMFAKHLDEQVDNPLAAEYKAARVELIRDYSQYEEGLWMREPQADGW